MESKVVSLRIPKELLDKLDRLADRKYPNRKSNRSQVILDAIELIVEQQNSNDERLLSTVNDIINKKLDDLEKKILFKVNNIIEGKKIVKLVSTKNDTVDKSLNMNLDEALKLANSRGYSETKKNFSGMFTKHKNDPNYCYYDIRRIGKGAGKPAIYTDVYSVKKNYDSN